MGVTAQAAPTFLLRGFRPAGQRSRCDFLSDQKVTKESPGNGSDERLRAAGAHSHLFPGPLITKVGHFGLFVISGGQNQDLFLSYSRPTGAYRVKNLELSALYGHRLAGYNRGS